MVAPRLERKTAESPPPTDSAKRRNYGAPRDSNAALVERPALRARLVAENKLCVVCYVLLEIAKGQSLRSACVLQRIPASTFIAWRDRFKDGGIEALTTPKFRPPAEQPQPAEQSQAA